MDLIRNVLAALQVAIAECDPVACIENKEMSCFPLSYTGTETDALEVRSNLMHLEVVEGSNYQRAVANFGSSYIRDEMVKRAKMDLPHIHENPRQQQRQ